MDKEALGSLFQKEPNCALEPIANMLSRPCLSPTTPGSLL